MANDFLTLIRTRRSIRAYRPDTVPADVLARVLEAGTYAPSAMGEQSAPRRAGAAPACPAPRPPRSVIPYGAYAQRKRHPKGCLFECISGRTNYSADLTQENIWRILAPVVSIS